ncbi:SIS domain-containing protein [Lacrimispora sp. 210928-DFI.3.58]|uniref:SIS domain-containing protein n=1 Tax=Lacrimispora sp. 210928-DFI.3.58 TaxID=2883214 RepID=UPI001D07F3CC|nr:SIS domain-containing protein [Lacrimispora sp. 210928-DFI.3.58]MCB7318799.1 SIS domain-containing protein [Lacrimispora sp. 210928-DFI.3.58]
MEKEAFYNPIREHIFSVPGLIGDELGRIFEEAKNSAAFLRQKDIGQIILTGCGYSYAASLSVACGLRELTGRQVTALPAIEAARFLQLPMSEWERTLVIGISNSGLVTRVNEAVATCRQQGAAAIGLTSNTRGELIRYCDSCLDISSPEFGRPLPLRGYAMTIAALLAVGCALTGNAGQGELVRGILAGSMEELEASLPEIDDMAWDYVQLNPALEQFEFVGSGYERGAAFLGKIEMMGQAGLMAVDEDTEQWLHCNFFMAAPERIGTILFLAKNSPGYSRAVEALSYMKHLKRPACVVTDDRDILNDPDSRSVYLPALNAVNGGLLQMTVPSLLTGYYCRLKGEEYSRGFRGPWEIFKDGRGTTKSGSDLLDELGRREEK